MPWEVKKNGSQWCVYKKGASSPIKGGCHAKKADAIKHMKALYVNVESSVHLDFPVTKVIHAENEDGPHLVTIPNVPIISTGIEYPLSTGPTTFTQGDLEDAVRALEDPAIHKPRVKLGYLQAEHGEAIAEPSFGVVDNLRLGDNGQTIYGDFTGVPAWLATILPVAYPSRSIEGNFNVTTVTGNKYQLVITAVALLGITMPGVTTLADLKGLYGDKVPEGVVVEGGDGMAVAAAVNVEDVRRKYYDHLDAQGPEYAWWWIRALVLNPNELIVDDDDGHLYRVPFEVDDTEVTFGEAKEVKIEYVDVPEQDRAAATAFVRGVSAVRDDTVVYATREEAFRPTPKTQKGGSSLDPKELRASLGLAEDASDDDVKSRISELRAEAEEPPEGGEGTEEGESSTEGEGEGEEKPEGEGESESGNESEATVSVDKEVWEETRRNAALARKHEEERIKTEDESLLVSAIQIGKIPPSRKDHYKKLLSADREGTKSLIESLEPGVVPVGERGAAGDGESGIAAQTDGLPEAWFPEIPRLRSQAQASGRVTMSKEG
jgi:hypothetical protein